MSDHTFRSAVFAVGVVALLAGLSASRGCAETRRTRADGGLSTVPRPARPPVDRPRVSMPAPPAQTHSDASPGEPEEPGEFRAVWLHTGAPAAGVRLVIGSDDDGVALVTGPEGEFRLEAAEQLTRLRGADEQFRVFVAPTNDVYVVCHAVLELIVTAEDLEPGKVPPGVAAEVTRLDHLEGPSLVPKAVLVQMGVPTRSRLRFRDGDRARARVPLVDKLVVSVSASGYRPVMKDVPAPTLDGVVSLHVHLEHTRRISGRLTDELGRPISRALVSVTVWKRGVKGRFTQRELLELQPIASSGLIESETHSTLSVCTYATTGTDGSWTTDLVLDGTIEVAAFVHSRPRAFAAVAWSQVHDVQLQMGAVVDASVRLEFAGSPIRHAQVSLVDVTTPAQVNAPYLETDADGVMCASFLEIGREYFVSARVADGGPRRRARLTWDGREVIVCE